MFCVSCGAELAEDALYCPTCGAAAKAKAAQAEADIEYAGFWIRLSALLIDTVILFVVGFAVGFVVGMTMLSDAPTINPEDPEIQLIFRVLGFIIGLAFTLSFWFSKQATPGKMIFGAEIADAKTLGKPSTGQFVGRYFAYILSALPLCFGFLWVAFDDRKQGWHDKLAGTVVVLKKK